MKIFPAIDIFSGSVVRLTQGDYNKVEKYAITPVEAATIFREKGAMNLHIVDLDGAKDGNLSNFESIREVVCSLQQTFLKWEAESATKKGSKTIFP